MKYLAITPHLIDFSSLFFRSRNRPLIESLDFVINGCIDTHLYIVISCGMHFGIHGIE